MELKKLFIYCLLILFIVSCGHTKAPRDLEEEFKKSLNGKIFKDNGDNYYMIKYEYNSHTRCKTYNITKVYKNDVKVFFK